MNVSPRRIVVLVLAAVAVVLPVVVLADVARSSADTARRGEPQALAPTDVASGRRAVTPLLSARRIPGIVTGQLATKPLLDQLGQLGAALPSPGCVSVVADGAKVYDQRATQPVVPASNQKLVAASVALDELGADFHFETKLVATTPPASGRVVGDLFLVGGGDPNLSTSAYLAHGSVNQQDVPAHPSSIEALADSVQAAGITEVTGRIVGDDHRYDSVRYVASWPIEYRLGHQAGPLGALMVDDDYVSFDPPLRTADDPAKRTATVLTALLRKRGITVGSDAGTGAAPEGAVDVVSPLRSAPLSGIVADLLTTSDNNTAELLLKEIGYHARQ